MMRDLKLPHWEKEAKELIAVDKALLYKNPIRGL
jgi:hypothetical protein